MARRRAADLGERRVSRGAGNASSRSLRCSVHSKKASGAEPTAPTQAGEFLLRQWYRAEQSVRRPAEPKGALTGQGKGNSWRQSPWCSCGGKRSATPLWLAAPSGGLVPYADSSQSGVALRLPPHSISAMARFVADFVNGPVPTTPRLRRLPRAPPSLTSPVPLPIHTVG